MVPEGRKTNSDASPVQTSLYGTVPREYTTSSEIATRRPCGLPMGVPSHIAGEHDHRCTVLLFCGVFDFSKPPRPPLIDVYMLPSRMFRALNVGSVLCYKRFIGGTSQI